MISIRLTDALYDALIQEALKLGITVSELIRRRLFVKQKYDALETRAQ